MEDWTRVVLYGTYDGFVRSTVESLKIAVRLDDGERVEIPSECVMSADQIVKKDEIKLKDVIKRIKCFDLVTQAVWINGILNELGSGYGLHKYHEGYKQGKLDGAMERKKMTVPQFVADWIEEAKKEYYSILGAINKAPKGEVEEWINLQNVETFAEAWVNGYEVEKKKRYLVKMKGIEGHNSYLKYNKNLKHWFFGSLFIYNNDVDTRTYHTHKELEDGGFGEVFNSPLFEVKEAEG